MNKYALKRRFKTVYYRYYVIVWHKKYPAKVLRRWLYNIASYILSNFFWNILQNSMLHFYTFNQNSTKLLPIFLIKNRLLCRLIWINSIFMTISNNDEKLRLKNNVFGFTIQFMSLKTLSRMNSSVFFLQYHTFPKRLIITKMYISVKNFFKKY